MGANSAVEAWLCLELIELSPLLANRIRFSAMAMQGVRSSSSRLASEQSRLGSRVNTGRSGARLTVMLRHSNGKADVSTEIGEDYGFQITDYMRYVLLVNTAVEWSGAAACVLTPEIIFIGIQDVGLESVRWYGITLSVFGLMSFVASRNLALTKSDSIWSGMTAYHPLIALCQVYRIFNYPQERVLGVGALIIHTALAIAFMRLYLNISDSLEDES